MVMDDVCGGQTLKILDSERWDVSIAVLIVKRADLCLHPTTPWHGTGIQ